MEKHTKSDGRTKTVDEAKRAAYSQKKPRYGLRKLSIGLVSCMVGYLCFFSAPVALTAEAAPVSGQGTPVETELGGSIEDTNAQDLTAEEPAAESALPVEGTSAPAVPVTEAAPTPKPLTAPAPAGTQDVPAEAVAAPAPAAPAAEAEATQHVTHGVALIGKGAKAAVARVVTSDGDNTTHKELVVGVDGNPADAGSDGVEDLSGIVVTLTGKDGAVVSGTADSWRGTKGFPLVQNFGLHDFAQGEYKVSISLGEGVKHWAVTKSSKLHNGDTVNVDGHLANLEVTLGYDTNGNGVADIDEAEATQHVTHGVALIGKGAKAAVARVVTSDGDNTTHKELVVGVDGNPADAGSDGVEDLSGIVVTLTGKDGAVVSGTADSWRGTKGFPLVQNFGLHDFAQGEYKVSISLGEGVKHWAVTKSSKLHNGDTVNVDGHLANLEVTLGYDTNGNGVADIDEDNAGRYEPNAVPTTTVKYGEGATTPAITFDDTFTDEKDQLDPQADDSPLKGTTFSIPELGNDAGAQINAATGQITLPEDAQPGTYTYTVTVEYPDMSHDTVDVRVVVTPITDELSAEGGRVVVPESITDGDLADALRGAVTVTGRDGGQVPLDDPRIASVAPKGALPEKTGEKDVEMTVTYSDGSTDTATVHATFVPDVVPVPDPDNPPAVPDGYVRVTFAGGEHGRIRDGATSTFMVNPKADVDLAGSAPAVDADAGWTHSGWDAPLAGRFASEATITATYTQDPKTPENPKDADANDPKGQDVSTEVGVTPDPSEGIENKGDLPGGTKYTWKEGPKVDAPGESPATVVVTYPDGSTDEVDVVVRVRQSDADANDPKGQDVSTEVGVTPDPSEGIENKGDLPGGTKYTWKEGPKVDAPGESPATVVVTYPDGSTDEVDVVVRVRQSDVTAQTPTEEKAKPKPKESAIPQTGDASALSGAAAAASMGFLSLLGGLAARRNRCKEDC